MLTKLREGGGENRIDLCTSFTMIILELLNGELIDGIHQFLACVLLFIFQRKTEYLHLFIEFCRPAKTCDQLACFGNNNVPRMPLERYLNTWLYHKQTLTGCISFSILTKRNSCTTINSQVYYICRFKSLWVWDWIWDVDSKLYSVAGVQNHFKHRGEFLPAFPDCYYLSLSTSD